MDSLGEHPKEPAAAMPEPSRKVWYPCVYLSDAQVPECVADLEVGATKLVLVKVRMLEKSVRETDDGKKRTANLELIAMGEAEEAGTPKSVHEARKRAAEEYE